MASEDIGNADPRALLLTLNAWDALNRLGSPEGLLALAQAAVYLACASKSNAVYHAFEAVSKESSSQPDYPVPNHLRNAPTRLVKELGFGEDYRYAHDFESGYVAGESYLPEPLKDARYYFPVERGLEKQIKQRLDYFRTLDDNSPCQRYPRSSQE